MFELKREVVLIDKVSYELKPLTGDYLEEFFTVIERLEPLINSKELNDDDVLKKMDPKAFALIHKLVTITLLKSYPDMENKREDLESFVTQNMFQFLGPFLQVNLTQTKK